MHKINLFATYTEVSPTHCRKEIRDRLPEGCFAKIYFPCVKYNLNGEHLMCQTANDKFFFYDNISKEGTTEPMKRAIDYAQRIVNRLIQTYPNKYMTRKDYLNSEEYAEHNNNDLRFNGLSDCNAEIPNNAYELMADRRVSRAQLASDLGVPLNSLQYYLSGKCFTPTILKRMCMSLRCTKEELIDPDYLEDLPLYGRTDEVTFKVGSYCRRNNISAEMLAKLVGVDKTTAYKYLDRTRYIMPKRLQRIAESLECDISELYELEV